ncbi:MAG: ATP-binding protein [Lachnospiraceae bacterium]|nr:ATP-binding protein [Lachnospiraceae bacterium]
MGQLTFQSLCRKLESRSSLNSYTEELNILTGAIASLIENPVAGSIAAFIKTLAEKEKLIRLGSTVLNAILKQVSVEDYCGRVKQMEEAYGIIYFTAFFDELDSCLPDNIRRNIQLSLKEKKNLFRSTAFPEDAGDNKREIMFPNIFYGYNEVEKVLKDMYSSMANRFRDFVSGLSFQDIAKEKDIRALDEVVKKLPSAAVKRFHDQYLTLCGKFNEFYIFMQLENEREKELKRDARYKNILSIAMRSQVSSEAGLANLETLIMDLPNQINEKKVQDIVDELIKTYKSSIDRPLIETKDDEENLTYPLISKAFIPQAYKLLQYSGKERLEQPEIWENLDSKQDMMSFWAKYYLDPNSVESLLLILGEPGGGKSLLTKILCARMITPMNICIRIPLREHDVEEEIDSIVCKQITRDGDASDPIRTFKSFAEKFQGSPITLLFDGYDEVMQATGGVYRNLLTRILKFQERCQEQDRPVRVIVTSRETLIDKVDIPMKTTVMKLLEFDETQKDQWIRIWNEHNHTTLAEAGIRDFALPEGSKSIEELAGQPLLLLMLAIYDANFESGTNALKQTNDETESMDRTKLYDELLRRFIRRELRKGPKGQDCPYEEATPEEQDTMVDEEMKKLGIAALGMFAREKLSLKVGELEDDLKYMNAKATKYDSQNKKMLKSAETVFGSFFFIHDSRTENEEDEKEAAFEFLHKTFYEFLVADLILQYLIDAADDLIERKRNSRRGESLYWDALDRPDSRDNAYYAALNSSCLCIEPEIIQMIAEWKDSKQIKYFQGKCPSFVDEMGQVLSDLFHKHMDIIRTGVFVPLTDKRGGLAGGKIIPKPALSI